MKTVYVKWRASYTSKVEVEDDFDLSEIGMEVDVPENESSKYECDTFEVEGAFSDFGCDHRID